MRRTNRRSVKNKRIKINTKKTKKLTGKKTNKKNTNVKFFMLSYEGNKQFAKLTQKTLKKEWGYTCQIIWGYKIDKSKYKPNTVVYEGFKDKVLPKMLAHNGPVYYLEDDIRFLEDPLSIPKKEVVWSVYRRGDLTNKPPHNVITGAQAIYFSKSSVKKLKDHMDKRKKSIHFDSYLSEFIRDSKVSFVQMKSRLSPPLKTGLGYEELHPSLIDPNRSWKQPPKKK